MYAITVKQPWAHYILNKGKNVENRTWPLPEKHKNQWIALHAGKTFDIDHCPSFAYLTLSDKDYGAILGLVKFSDCINDAQSDWAVKGQYHWIISQICLLDKPIPCNGALRFWKVPQDIEIEMKEQALNQYFLKRYFESDAFLRGA